MSNKALIDNLAKELPLILWRSNWPKYQELFGVPFSRGTMQNRDSQGVGPKSGKMGGKVYYTRQDFIAWLETLSTD